jgi:hypothetical protein
VNFAALSTAALAATALAAAAAVITLYLLRRTPRVQVVSSVEFWRRAVERSRPRALFATRVPWLALLLSLAVALLLVGEMGDPRVGTGYSGTTVIVLSADRTMSARDDRGRRRLDDALALARATVQSDTVTGQVALVRAGLHPEVLAPLTHRAADADRALVGLDADDATADLSAAVAVGRAIVRATHGPGRVLVVADRDDFDRAASPDVAVVLAAVGSPGETLAVTGLDARRDPLALGEYQVRCEVRSYSARRARARLVIRDRDAVLLDQRIAPGPGEVITQRARGFSSAQAEISARLEDVDIEGGHDALPADDVAYAAVAPVVATRVLLVTRGDRYLANALAANPAVELETVDPAGLEARRRTLGRYQVVVLDRVAPSPPLDHAAQLLVGAAPTRALRVGAEVGSPRVTAFAADHRVLAGLRFDQVQIARARPLLADPDDRVLVRSGHDALVLARDRDGDRTLALGFDTAGTDLVQRVAFPLFMHNALVWLDRREREFHSWQAPGEPIRASGSPAVVLTPSGAGREVRGALYDTARAGIYHTADRAIAVSAAGEAGALAAVEGSSDARRGAARGRAPVGQLLAGAILALLCVEWALTMRGRLQ